METTIIECNWFMDLCNTNAQAHLGFLIIVKPGLKKEVIESVIEHEKKHIQQQRETFIFPFYLVYLSNYLYNTIKYGDTKKAYNNILFEKILE